ncbi:hypothetical protein DVS28_a0097 [Euzebya pacifica]|uniref:Uncharacterized protein n=1 Tax=Euzebya pacifica TaxID=1608957 RepID=A0A346XRF8_9ACTN|nr:hypothetical protein [Euzebya pacifica]AXV04805.1 hypothetical protein DVS28_a0097 [Euzebya pacifica]
MTDRSPQTDTTPLIDPTRSLDTPRLMDPTRRGRVGALALSALAALALAVPMPIALRGALVLAFVAVGPGLAVVGPDVRRLGAGVVVVVSVAVSVVVSTTVLLIGPWSGPRALQILVGVTVVAATAGLLLRQRKVSG